MSVIDNYKLIIEKINQQSNKKITLVADNTNLYLIKDNNKNITG